MRIDLGDEVVYGLWLMGTSEGAQLIWSRGRIRVPDFQRPRSYLDLESQLETTRDDSVISSQGPSLIIRAGLETPLTRTPGFLQKLEVFFLVGSRPPHFSPS